MSATTTVGATTPTRRTSARPAPARRRIWPRVAAAMAKHAVLIVVSLMFLMPLFWMVSGSLKTASDIGQFPIVWFPDVITTGNYSYGLSAFPFVS